MFQQMNNKEFSIGGMYTTCAWTTQHGLLADLPASLPANRPADLPVCLHFCLPLYQPACPLNAITPL